MVYRAVGSERWKWKMLIDLLFVAFVGKSHKTVKTKAGTSWIFGGTSRFEQKTEISGIRQDVVSVWYERIAEENGRNGKGRLEIY